MLNEAWDVAHGPRSSVIVFVFSGLRYIVLESMTEDVDSLELTYPDHFFQKCTFFGDWLQESHHQVRACYLESKPRESCPCSDIKKSPLEVDVTFQEETLAKVAGYAILIRKVADKVDSGVPLEEQVKVSEQLLSLLASQSNPKRFEEINNLGSPDHRPEF